MLIMLYCFDFSTIMIITKAYIGLIFFDAVWRVNSARKYFVHNSTSPLQSHKMNRSQGVIFWRRIGDNEWDSVNISAVYYAVWTSHILYTSVRINLRVLLSIFNVTSASYEDSLMFIVTRCCFLKTIITKINHSDLHYVLWYNYYEGMRNL